jgi:hypothetical protein
VRKYARLERAIDTQSSVDEGLSVDESIVHEVGKNALEFK